MGKVRYFFCFYFQYFIFESFSFCYFISCQFISFVTIPLETHHETQVSFRHCLMALSYAIIIKDLCTEGHKSRNNLPKKIGLNKKVGCLRWRKILLEGYQVFMKKGWKRLVGHPYERGKCSIFFLFIFSTLFLSHFLFVILFPVNLFYFYFIQFLTTINLLMFVFIRKDCY